MLDIFDLIVDRFCSIQTRNDYIVWVLCRFPARLLWSNFRQGHLGKRKEELIHAEFTNFCFSNLPPWRIASAAHKQNAGFVRALLSLRCGESPRRICRASYLYPFQKGKLRVLSTLVWKGLCGRPDPLCLDILWATGERLDLDKLCTLRLGFSIPYQTDA